MQKLLLLIFILSTNILSKSHSPRKTQMNMPHKEEFEIPLTEDLMREHGLLNRMLLIYEELIRRINETTEFPLDALEHTTDIVKAFIEDYHEKLEEEYVFPIFEKHNKEVRLVKTLRTQHNKGREITARLRKITANKTIDRADKRTIKILLQKFIRMYRPHEAREDTVLFPQVRSLISEKEFNELSEKFEAREQRLFGEHGFERMVERVASIEKQLGIYQLEQFTPQINK